MHPQDELVNLGFENRGYGEYEGYVNGMRYIFSVGQVNAGPDYADEEPFWETEVFVENEFGQVERREVVATTSSERSAISAAVDYVRDRL